MVYFFVLLLAGGIRGLFFKDKREEIDLRICNKNIDEDLRDTYDDRSGDIRKRSITDQGENT